MNWFSSWTNLPVRIGSWFGSWFLISFNLYLGLCVCVCVGGWWWWYFLDLGFKNNFHGSIPENSGPPMQFQNPDTVFLGGRFQFSSCLLFPMGGSFKGEGWSSCFSTKQHHNCREATTAYSLRPLLPSFKNIGSWDPVLQAHEQGAPAILFQLFPMCGEGGRAFQVVFKVKKPVAKCTIATTHQKLPNEKKNQY